MGDQFYVDPEGLSGVIALMRHSADNMGRGADNAPQPADAGDSTDASADALKALMEETGGVVQAVDDLTQRLTQVRDEYARGDHAGAEQLSGIDPR